MSQVRKARLEQQKKHEQIKRRLQVGVAGVALAATGISVYSHLEDAKQTKNMPHEVAKIVEDASQKQGNESLKLILKQDYREVVNDQIGNVRVRVAEIGAPTPTDYNKILDTYRSLSVYLAAKPEGAEHLVTVFDSSDQIINNLKIKTRITPVGKDVTVFSVPQSLNIGAYAGNPDVFTETEGREVASFIRPDLPDANEGMITEACQGMVQVEVANPEVIAQNKRDKVQLLLQEQFCNAVAKAMNASQNGESYGDYVEREKQGSRQMFTDQNLVQGETGYVSKMPYIGSETAYLSISHEIPLTIGTDFTFPPVMSQ